MRAALLLAIAIALAASGCKSSSAAGASDAAADARAPRDAGLEAEAGATAATMTFGGDAGPRDEGVLPAVTSDELTLRARHLFEAIAQDNPDLGVDMLFPRDAWMAARDATDPGRQWDAKVAAAFRRSVHALHKRTKGAEHAQFVSFEIGRTVTQATPHRKEWTAPLWQVHHARITFSVDGRAQRWDVSELTSWRGAWYVSKLR